MAEDSAHYEILGITVTAIEAKITDATLLGIVADDVLATPVPAVEDPSLLNSLPSITVSPIGLETLPDDEATNESDAYEYPVLVCIIAKAQQDLVDFYTDTTKLKRYMYWRQILLDLFQKNSAMYAGVTVAAGLNIASKVEPDVIVDLQSWNDRGLYVSCFQILVTIDRIRRT